LVVAALADLKFGIYDSYPRIASNKPEPTSADEKATCQEAYGVFGIVAKKQQEKAQGGNLCSCQA